MDPKQLHPRVKPVLEHRSPRSSLSFFFFETGFHYVAQIGLELTILLPQSSEHWDYMYAHDVCLLFL
jgi:hypothetical protein